MSPRPIRPIPSEYDAAVDHASHGRWSQAIAAVEAQFARAESPDPPATPAALALAEIARMARDAGEEAVAERALEAAVRLRPKFADLQYQYACALLARSRRPEARRALEAALAANPRFVVARLDLALLDAREGRVGEGLAGLRMLARDTEVGDGAAFDRGLRSLERADWDEAESLLRRALRLEDTELLRRIERFHQFMKREEYDRAAETLREVLPRHEAYPDLHGLLGTAELRLGHYDDAIASLGRALELNPNYHEARVQLALALEAVGMAAAALEQMSLVLEHDPANRTARSFVNARAAAGPRGK